MTQPLVSIIIPCFDTADYVGEAIESALAQTYTSVEVIVIDDGSTDDSLDVIRSFGDRIRWETGPNRGACAARNRGLELSAGEIIQFLDADDLLYSQKLSRQVPQLKSGLADVVFCDVTAVDAVSGNELRHYHPHYSDSFQQCCADPITCPGPLMWKADLVEAGGFDIALPCAQERDLHIRMACLGYRFEHFPETLVTVRRRANSLSSDSLRVLDQHKQIVIRGYNILLKRDEATDDRCRALAGVLARDARAYLRYGMKDKAADYFSAAREIHSEGGLELAYSRPTRVLRQCIGPRLTEQLVDWRRRFQNGPDSDERVSTLS